ncbi:TniQ family protein [Mesorhizobium sp. M0046]|uniref:TniQ family protein n=1 Tax=Mesorhizobium sp. M0046 TaxID=2956858 RepID=UPI003337D6BF
MTGTAEFAIEVQSHYREIHSDRWPVVVVPQADELLSSWLNRLAFANGIAPRHFADVFGIDGGMWSARLDLALPDGAARLLHHYSGVARDTLAAMTLAQDERTRLLLPLRQTGPRGRSTWLQFCPQCLTSDLAPYFRRRWRMASSISCPMHGCGLRDRCPSCGSGTAAFNQSGLIPQHHCATCHFDLRTAAKVSVKAATRRFERCLHDMLRMEAAKGFLAKSSLIARLLSLPTAVDPGSARTLINLSSAARIRCFDQIAEECHDHLTAGTEAFEIIFWRQRILAAGSLAAALQPLCQWMRKRVMIEDEAPQRTIDIQGVDLSALIGAYRRVRERQLGGHGTRAYRPVGGRADISGV